MNPLHQLPPPESPDTSFLELTSSPADEEGDDPIEDEPEPIEQVSE